MISFASALALAALQDPVGGLQPVDPPPAPMVGQDEEDDIVSDVPS